MAYHVEIRQFPRNARKFNVERAELDALLRGWVSEPEVVWADQEWQTRKAKLAVLDGEALQTAEMGMGRGWPEAQRRSRDVTEELLSAARQAPAVGTDARPLLRQLIGDAPVSLGDLVGLLTGAGVDPRAAEAAVWALLQGDELELVRPPAG